MSGVLARIDAAVEQRCACGCGAQLAPDGPSGWFATADCQHRWAQQHATDPQQVYGRPDAAPVYLEGDGRRVGLRGGQAGGRVADELAAPVVALGTQQSYWCPQCSNVAEPIRYLLDGAMTARCAHCQAATPAGLRVFVEWDTISGALALLVAFIDTGSLRPVGIRARVSDRELAAAEDPAALLGDLLVRLQQGLFAAYWTPSPPPADPGIPEWLLIRHPGGDGWHSIGRNLWRGRVRGWGSVAYVLADATQQHSVSRTVAEEFEGRIPRERILRDLQRHLEYETTPPCVVTGCGEKGRYRFTAAAHGMLAGRRWNPGDEIRLCPAHSADVYGAHFGDREPGDLPEWMRSGTSWTQLGMRFGGSQPLGWLEGPSASGARHAAGG